MWTRREGRLGRRATRTAAAPSWKVSASRYVPVTPEASSSGTYSGGAPFERTQSPQELGELSRALDAAVGAQARIKERQ